MKNMELIRPFERLGKNDAGIAGGKGASLGEMTQAGIPVPPGFVVLAGAFERFLQEADLNQELDAILHSVNHDEIHTVENASAKIQQLILAAEMPKDIADEIVVQFKKLGAQHVAVRSSATAEDSSAAAWAGQLDTFLNTTEDKLLKNVQRCWASLFTPRAIFYRFEKGMHGDAISVAVVVQKMVESECSGIAFSVHPVTEDYNQLIIEAGFGLGEAIVSGQVTPDSYVVEKTPRRIIDKNISSQTRALYRGGEEGNEWKDIPEPRASSQVLSDEQILELSELVLRIEKHYGFPCDIEWAFEAGKFYITQSRPITTLKDVVMEKGPFTPREWELWLSRPFDLFITSVWNGWYASRHLEDMLGMRFTSGLFIEHPKGIARHYREKEKLEAFKKAIKHIALNEPARAEAILDEAERLNAEAEKMLLEVPPPLTELVDFIIRLALHSVIFPLVAGEVLSQENAKSPLSKKCKPLRAVSHYPQLFSSLLVPLVEKKAVEHGFSVEDARRTTIREFLTEDFHAVAARKEMAAGKSFVFEDVEGREKVSFVEDSASVVSLIDGVSENNTDSIQGATAFRGIARGTARLILNNDITSVTFNDGDILVAISTNPALMPLMQKAGAFVTDEGGMTCHAAIIARELEKPCIVGTRNATRAIKDGDMVEVDAEKGIVRILNHV